MNFEELTGIDNNQGELFVAQPIYVSSASEPYYIKDSIDSEKLKNLYKNNVKLSEIGPYTLQAILAIIL